MWEAYRRVKANKGAAGVDGQSLADFEEDLRNNLYKIWNRMSSGTYFPPPVKGGGNTEAAWRRDENPRGAHCRGPNRADRGGTAAGGPDGVDFPSRLLWVPAAESAHDALRKCRERCWQKDWVLDLDIRKFFDSVDHDLVVKTVEANTADNGWCCMSSGG